MIAFESARPAFPETVAWAVVAVAVAAWAGGLSGVP